jgi:hypothetical protein
MTAGTYAAIFARRTGTSSAGAGAAAGEAAVANGVGCGGGGGTSAGGGGAAHAPSASGRTQAIRLIEGPDLAQIRADVAVAVIGVVAPP